MTTLSAPSVTAVTQTTATLSVTTNEGDWHLYWAIRTTSAYTASDAAIIKSGAGSIQNGRLSGGVNPTGVNSGPIKGLAPGTTYFVGFVQEYNDSTSYPPLWDHPLIFGPTVLPTVYDMQNYVKQNKGEVYGIALSAFTPYNPGTITCTAGGTLTIGAGTPKELFSFTISGWNSVGKSESIVQVDHEASVTINYYFVPNVLLEDYLGKQNINGLHIRNVPDLLSIKFGVFNNEIVVIPAESVDVGEFAHGVSKIILIFTDIMQEIWLLWNEYTGRFEGKNRSICEYIEESAHTHHSVPVYVEFQL